MSTMRRVGHKGADHISPGNTFAAFEAALEHGVDMIEFDVLPEHPDGSGELVLAHDWEDAGSRRPHTLEEGLEHFADAAYDGIELDVDLKMAGYEERVARALERHGLVERSLISTMEEPSLALLRARHPQIRLGWSVPRIRRDPLRNPIMALPGIAIEALMAHWRLVTPALATAINRAGGELYVWTVDDPRRIRELERMGVSGVISNDPRLFDET